VEEPEGHAEARVDEELEVDPPKPRVEPDACVKVVDHTFPSRTVVGRETEGGSSDEEDEADEEGDTVQQEDGSREGVDDDSLLPWRTHVRAEDEEGEEGEDVDSSVVRIGGDKTTLRDGTVVGGGRDEIKKRAGKEEEDDHEEGWDGEGLEPHSSPSEDGGEDEDQVEDCRLKPRGRGRRGRRGRAGDKMLVLDGGRENHDGGRQGDRRR